MPPDEPKARPLYVGIDLGGTKLLAVVTSGNEERLASAVAPTPEGASAVEVVAAMADAARRAAREAGAGMDEVCAIGVAAAGAIDLKNGAIVHSPHLPAFRRTPVAPMLRDILKKPVVIGNDANLAALGEHRFGAGRGVTDLVYITVSTGIGGGIIADNRLFVGAGGYAGEIGHMSVDAHGPLGKSTVPGAWESLCAGTALVRIANERLQAGEQSSLATVVAQRGEFTAIDVFESYHAGDAVASDIVRTAVEYMGAALTNVVNILNPAMLIIGGGLSNEWDDYIAPAVETMREQSFAGIGVDVPVVPPALGAEAGALGAAALAMDACPNA